MSSSAITVPRRWAFGWLALALFPLVAPAATFTVTTADDEFFDGTETVGAPDGAGLSLREAIGLANAAAGSDTINFAAGLTGATITLSTIELVLSGETILSGTAGGGAQTIDGTDASRVLRLAAGQTATISDLILTNGNAGVATDGSSDGGCLLIESGASAALTNVNMTGCDGFSGGAIDVNAGATLTITGGNFTGNTAIRAGGAIEHAGGAGSVVTLTNVMGSGNSTGPTPGNGGFLHVTGAGSTNISGGTLQMNTAAREGGGLWNDSGTMTLSGALTINQNTASGPAADDGGGGLFQNPVGTTNIGSGVRITNNIADGAAGSGGGILNLSIVNISGATINGNRANRAGGGIEAAAGTTTTLSNSSFLNNNNAGVAPAVAAPGNGGGLHITGNGNATIGDTQILGNTAALEGGGLWNGSGIMTIQTNTQLLNNRASGPAADDGGGGLFQNTGGTTNISGTVLFDGNIADGAAGSGGGILNLSIVNLTGAVNVQRNRSNRAGGGIEAAAGSTTTMTGGQLFENNTGVAPASANPGNGGGLHITGNGNATLNNVFINTNVAALEGGGLWNGSGTMNIGGTTEISQNTASGPAADDGGGGLFQAAGGTSTITGTVQINNNIANGAAGSGGGILNLSIVNATGTAIRANRANRAGGGIEAAAGTTTTLTNVNLTQNNAGVAPATASPGNGGGLHITGNGNLTYTGGSVGSNLAALEGGGLWNGSGTMTLSGLDISSNTASGPAADDGGGGVFNNGGTLNISNTRLDSNIADGASGSGGGILNNTGGTLVMNGGSLSGNRAPRAGGGIEDNAGAGVTLTNVTVNSNTTSANPGNGGGLHITGAGNVTINTSTFSNNTAANEGGGLWNSAAGSLTLNSTTVSNNVSPAGGGVFKDGTGGTTTLSSTTVAGNTGTGLTSEGGAFTLRNSVISDNSAAACAGVGAYTSNGFNLLNPITGCTITPTSNDITGQSAQLGPLANNGGSTQTRLPGLTSPLIDAGSCAAGLDQRGTARPIDITGLPNADNGCDIGAVEATSGGIPFVPPSIIPSTDRLTLLGLLALIALMAGRSLRRRQTR